MRGRADDAGPNEPVYQPSALVEEVLGLLETAGCPGNLNDRVADLIEEWERSKAPAVQEPSLPVCPGFGPHGTGPKCCDRAGEYNGFGSDGPSVFTCPNHCPCHD